MLRELDYELEDIRLSEVDRRSPRYISWVQRSLNLMIGAKLAVDGRWGPRTRQAVRLFQQRQGLRVDGNVGPQTEAALIKAGAIPLAGRAVKPSPVSRQGPLAGFKPTPVETPGGGRIRVKRDPAPGDLVTVVGIRSRKIQLHRLAAKAWQAMVSAARADGIRHPLLLPTSGYRSSQHQARLWQAALRRYGSPGKARKWVAPPGGSAHQSGGAIDFFLGGRKSSGNAAHLRKLPAFKWLAKNARRFGFYPYIREPWHWEYNPPARVREAEAELEFGC